MIKSVLITLLLSYSAFAQMRPDMTSNPSSGFGTLPDTTDTSLPRNNDSTTQDNRGNNFPQQQQTEESNNFAGGALGGASPGATIPETPRTTSPGVAPTTPQIPKSGIGTGTTFPGSTVPMTP